MKYIKDETQAHHLHFVKQTVRKQYTFLRGPEVLAVPPSHYPRCGDASVFLSQTYNCVLQELAEHVERCASQLRPGSILLVLQAFGRYDLPVSGLVATLADAAEGQLSMLK